MQRDDDLSRLTNLTSIGTRHLNREGVRNLSELGVFRPRPGCPGPWGPPDEPSSPWKGLGGGPARTATGVRRPPRGSIASFASVLGWLPRHHRHRSAVLQSAKPLRLH